MFDINTLPEKIDREHIFDFLISKIIKNENKSLVIRNSVDFKVSVLDLAHEFSNSSNIIKNIDALKDKREIFEALLGIKIYLEKLKELSIEYDKSILEQEESLTQEILEEEKNLYLMRRNYSKLDIH